MRPSSVAVVLAFALASSAIPISSDVAAAKRTDSMTRVIESRAIGLASETGVLPIWKRHSSHNHQESEQEEDDPCVDDDDEDDSDGQTEHKGDDKPESKSKQVPNPFPKDDGHPKVTPLPGGEPSGQPQDDGNKEPDQQPQDDPNQQPQGDGDKKPDEQPQDGGDKKPDQQPEGDGDKEPEQQPSGGSGNSTADAYVQPHNAARARHNAQPVSWDDNLAAMAQKWVNGCDFQHSGGSLADFTYGENLAAGTSDNYNAGDAVQGWVDEEKDYDPNNPEAHGVGHFTQVVWKSTTTVGCAVADCPAGTGPFGGGGTWRYHSCVYTPAGNFIGKYKENVE